MSNKIILPVVLIFFFTSCEKEHDFKYSGNKDKYLSIVSCIRNNINSLFPAIKKEREYSICNSYKDEPNICNLNDQFFNDNLFDCIDINKDSTVSFYKRLEEGFKTKEHILIFVKDKQTLLSKLNVEYRIIKQNDSSCYELEHNSSIAN